MYLSLRSQTQETPMYLHSPKKRRYRPSLTPLIFPFIALIHTFLTAPDLSATTLLNSYPRNTRRRLSVHNARTELEDLLESPRARQLQRQLPTNSPFILFRALGNDLPPRHALGQTRANLEFILKHEPRHPGVERRWLLNRIVRAEEELAIVRMLIENGETFVRDAIDFAKYRTIDFNLPVNDTLHTKKFFETSSVNRDAMLADLTHDKNQYVMHNNQARNKMLKLGIEAGAEYVLPFDGNCYFNQASWLSIKGGIENIQQEAKAGELVSDRYFIVNMTRMTANEPLLDNGFIPEQALEEPQIIFRKDAKARFYEGMRYGRRPKVELLWRLKVPGTWDIWVPNYPPWSEGATPGVEDVKSAVEVRRAGWTARLFSGMKELEGKNASKKRGRSRVVGVEKLLGEAWVEAVGTGKKLLWYNEQSLAQNRFRYKSGDNEVNQVVQALVQKAEGGVRFADSSLQDVRGNRLEMETGRYSFKKWENFVNNVIVLSLAGYFTGEGRYYRRAADMVRVWLVDKNTAINPNLREAQTQIAESSHREGLQEFVNMPILLDAIQLLHRAEALSDQDMEPIRSWMQNFAMFLQSDELAIEDYLSPNHRGTLHDAQAAAVYYFLEDWMMVLRHTSVARLRMHSQFDEHGGMREELKSTRQSENVVLGLQSWIWLARISERVGVDLWHWEGVLKRATEFGVPGLGKFKWKFEEEVDDHRLQFLRWHAREKIGMDGPKEACYSTTEVLIPPFWCLGA